MNSRYLIVFLLLTIFSLSSLSAQEEVEKSENLPDNAVTQTPLNTESSLPNSTKEEAKKIEESVKKKVKKDIDEARQEELIRWCHDLNLDESGTFLELREHLYVHYGIGTASVEKTDKRENTIYIRSAKETEYFKVEEVDEEVIRFSGDVLLEIEETKPGRTHSIRADEVVFNKKNQRITATGKIEYTLKSDTGNEVFTGDSLTFNIDKWNGVIYYGESVKDQKIEGVTIGGTTYPEATVQFYFSGENISRSGANVVVMDKAKITSGNLKDPDYHLRASKIWVMGEEEWGILHGILYIGNVPVLYIPFYYKPGNDLLFNPAIGADNVKGVYINTTLYIIGQKKSSGGVLNFLALDSADGEIYQLERHGLYLYKINKIKSETSENRLRVMVDYYSSLGGFAEIDGYFKEPWVFDSIDFFLGVGVTKSIDSYNNIFFDIDGEYKESWNSSYSFGTYMPLRWGAGLKFSMPYLNFEMEYYTDPYYKEDFIIGRKENFDWLDYILSDLTAPVDTTTITTTNKTTSLNWLLSSTIPIPVEKLNPYITQFTIDNLKASATFSILTDADVYSEDPYAPTAEFFYPSSFILPYINFSLAGNFLDWQSGIKNDEDSDESLTNNGGISPPWAKDSKTESNNPDSSKDISSDFILPEKEAGVIDLLWDDVTSFKLGYLLKPLFSLEQTNDATGWDSPTDVELDLKQSQLVTGGIFDLNYDLSAWEELFGIDGKLYLMGNYKTHVDMTGNAEDITEAEKATDVSGSYFKWNEDLRLYSYPFKMFSYFKKSSANYYFNSTLFQYKYDTSDQSNVADWYEWDSEFTSKHQTTHDFVFDNGFLTAGTELNFYLPPMDEKQEISPYFQVTYKTLTGSLRNTINHNEEGDNWTIDPLEFNASFNLFDKEFQVSQQLKYDWENETFSLSDSYLYLWGFYTRFIANYSPKYTWDKGTTTWTVDDSIFQPSSLEAGYKKDHMFDPFWKNRVSMGLGVETSWNINLIQPNDNVFRFGYSFLVNIYQFMDLRISVTSANKQMYLYFEEWRDYFGIEYEYNLFEDLAKSFNFFQEGQTDRYESFFNLEKVNIDLVHHLRDWDLYFTYAGYPFLKETTYQWRSELMITIKWNPIPKINAYTKYNDETWSAVSGAVE